LWCFPPGWLGDCTISKLYRSGEMMRFFKESSGSNPGITSFPPRPWAVIGLGHRAAPNRRTARCDARRAFADLAGGGSDFLLTGAGSVIAETARLLEHAGARVRVHQSAVTYNEGAT
jgi:hypothetical protein